MYKCSVCKKEVIVNGVDKPIRACDCTVDVVVDGKPGLKLAPIIADMGEATLKGHGLFNKT